MRRFLPLIALGIGAYIAFLISAFPAVTALRWFAPPQLRTSNVSGTIWAGTARFASVDRFAVRDLSWNVDALPLLLARLGGDVQARLSNGFVNTRFSASGSRIRLQDLQLSTTIGALSTALPVSGARGALSAQFDDLELEATAPADSSTSDAASAVRYWPTLADGSIRVSDLLVEPYAGLGSGLIPLGSFELDLSGTSPEALAAQIRDLGGPLEFTGMLRVTPRLQYSLSGLIAPRANASEQLVQGLAFISSEPNAQGKRTLTLEGSL